MFKNAKIKGLLRYSAQYRDTEYHSTQDGEATVTPSKVKQYSALGGYLGIETAPLYNISLGATFYTANGVGNNPDNRLGLGGLNEDGGKANNYTVLGESYIKFKTKENDLRYGRREMPNYRFVSLSNIRFSPITHEGITYENKTVKDLKFTLGYIQKQKERNSETFIDMVRAARINEKDIEGEHDTSNYIEGSYNGAQKSMSMLGTQLIKKDFSLEIWDYYVDDFVNTLYLYGDYKFNVSKTFNITVAGQYASQNSVGSHVAGDIKSWFYGLKTQAAWNNGVTTFLNFNQIAYNENSYDGGTIFVRWGTPQMFNSFQVQDSELAGTKSLGAGLQLELGRMGIVPNTVVRFRYGIYNMPDNIQDKYAAQDRKEATFDLRYSFNKNDGFGIFTEMDGLSVQFRMAYDDYKTDYDYAAYIAEHVVDFKEVTKNFLDTRLYIDYVF